MLAIVVAIKLIAEIALFALMGEGVLGRLLGPGRDRNPFYGLLQLLGRPWLQAARWISPRAVLDRHVGRVAFMILLLAWGAASFAKVGICLRIGVALCK